MNELTREVTEWCNSHHIFYKEDIDEFLSLPALRAMVEDARKYHEALPLVKMMQEKADQWDALGFVTSYVTPEDYEQIKKDAALWRKAKEIAEGADFGCHVCPHASECDQAEGCLFDSAKDVVKALEAHDEQE